MGDEEPIVPGAVPAPSGRTPLPPEDEDLFDFPVIEMRPSLAKAKAAPAAPIPGSHVSSAAADAARVARAAKALENEDLLGADAALGPRSAETQKAADALIAAAGREVDAKAAKRSAPPPAPAARPAPVAAVVPPADDELVPTARAGGRAARATTHRLVLAAVAALVATQVGLALLAWNGQREDRSRIDELRRELALATQGLSHSTVRAGAPAAGPEPARAEAAPPLEAFEEQALALARSEIAEGAHDAARARLHRLLCVADRVDAARRERIEGEAAFLIAESWRATPRVPGGRP